MASAARKPRPRKALSGVPEIQPEDREDHFIVTFRAYELWQARGCPIGSPEVDWFQAEELLRAERARGTGTRAFFEIEQKDDICVVSISGRFATGTDYTHVAATTREIKSIGANMLIADIRALESIGSEGIGFFVELHASMTRKPGGRFLLAGPAPRVLEVLGMCGLGLVIRTTPDLETALALCASSPSL